MKDVIVSSECIVALIGGSVLNPNDLEEVLSFAPLLVAADGGAVSALNAGHRPEAVIGDMDSLPDSVAAQLSDRLFPISEQESTDFDKALRHIQSPLVLAVGFSGGRLDHELAVMNALVRHPDRPCIVVGRETLTFLAPRDILIDLEAGTTVSLFPMGQAKARDTGLKWSIDGLVLSPEGRVGTSNKAKGPVHLQTETANLLIILPRSVLSAAIRALAAVTPAGRWSARGQ